MRIFLEAIRDVIGEMNIADEVETKLREVDPPFSTYDPYVVEDLLLQEFENIASELTYNIDVSRQEKLYGKSNVPKLNELIQDKFRTQPITVKPAAKKLVIIRQVEDK